MNKIYSHFHGPRISVSETDRKQKKIAEYMAFQVVISLTKENKVGKRNSETERKALIIRMVREDFLRK